jgi:hypothetical protein
VLVWPEGLNMPPGMSAPQRQRRRSQGHEFAYARGWPSGVPKTMVTHQACWPLKVACICLWLGLANGIGPRCSRSDLRADRAGRPAGRHTTVGRPTPTHNTTTQPQRRSLLRPVRTAAHTAQRRQMNTPGMLPSSAITGRGRSLPQQPHITSSPGSPARRGSRLTGAPLPAGRHTTVGQRAPPFRSESLGAHRCSSVGRSRSPA